MKLIIFGKYRGIGVTSFFSQAMKLLCSIWKCFAACLQDNFFLDLAAWVCEPILLGGLSGKEPDFLSYGL